MDTPSSDYCEDAVLAIESRTIGDGHRKIVLYEWYGVYFISKLVGSDSGWDW